MLYQKSIFLLLGFFAPCLQAVLDGRVAPIVVDYRYTFTNWELARGYVSFEKGFDLPLNGTITLQLSSKSSIYDSINMNRGSIQLIGGMYLGPSFRLMNDGFIFSKGTTPGYIYFDDELIFDGNYIGIKGSELAIRSSRRGRLDFINEAKLDIKNVTSWTISNCRVFDHGTSILPSTTLNNGVGFHNCSLLVGIDNPTEWLGPKISLSGIGTIATINTLKVRTITMNSTTEWTVLSGSRLQAEALLISLPQTRFSLFNTTLDMVSTSTNPIPLGDSGSGSNQGYLSIMANCSLTSSTGNSIYLLRALSMEMQEGARLLLDNVRFSVQ